MKVCIIIILLIFFYLNNRQENFKSIPRIRREEKAKTKQKEDERDKLLLEETKIINERNKCSSDLAKILNSFDLKSIPALGINIDDNGDILSINNNNEIELNYENKQNVDLYQGIDKSKENIFIKNKKISLSGNDTNEKIKITDCTNYFYHIKYKCTYI